MMLATASDLVHALLEPILAPLGSEAARALCCAIGLAAALFLGAVLAIVLFVRGAARRAREDTPQSDTMPSNLNRDARH